MPTVLRKPLLWASTNPFLAERLPKYRFVQDATRRFMPGEHVDDALREAARLSGLRIATTLTLLGEHVESAAAADAVLAHYLDVLARVREKGLSAEVSVKPSQIGLGQGSEGAAARLERLLAAAGTASTVWIDMEGSAFVDATLELFKAARRRQDNVGLCLQAYLRRTPADLEGLLDLKPAIRLVKGAYMEPDSVAFSRKAEVDQSFVRLAGILLRARKNGTVGRPIIATHDTRMIGEANRVAFELNLPKDAYEVSMLYGIRRQEQERLARNGYTVRVLISYGEAWFPWYMRRLAERPANVLFVLKQMVTP
jgi:proline dehydrogenase